MELSIESSKTFQIIIIYRCLSVKVTASKKPGQDNQYRYQGTILIPYTRKLQMRVLRVDPHTIHPTLAETISTSV